jgi:hypothetical protein
VNNHQIEVISTHQKIGHSPSISDSRHSDHHGDSPDDPRLIATLRSLVAVVTSIRSSVPDVIASFIVLFIVVATFGLLWL